MILRAVALSVSVCASLASHATPVRAQGAGPHLTPGSAVKAPTGAEDLCSRYVWACRSGGAANLLDEESVLSTAQTINRQINRGVRPIEDLAQYRAQEHWALPTKRGGDCEDIALLKKKELIELGVPADQLLIATVFDTSFGAHAVLILRLDSGDLVLDNLTDRIKPWHGTGYVFMRMQNPAAPDTWVLASSRG